MKKQKKKKVIAVVILLGITLVAARFILHREAQDQNKGKPFIYTYF